MTVQQIYSQQWLSNKFKVNNDPDKWFPSQLVIFFPDLEALLHLLGDRNGGERMSADPLANYNNFLATYTTLRDIII